ncbi:MAG: hypothetical protein PHT07_06410 [Paludibacter sp.]|nr:hypothetical protein [Paludibacter sp.]
MNKINNTYLISLFFIFFFGACKDPKNEDIIGVWKTDNNALFQFYKDKTFKVSNIPESILFSIDSDNKFYTGSGVWDLKYYENNWEIELNFSKYYCPLYIEKGFYNKKFLWQLYFYDGAQDTKYYFYRVNP